jgi:hypothetical protein
VGDGADEVLAITTYIVTEAKAAALYTLNVYKGDGLLHADLAKLVANPRPGACGNERVSFCFVCFGLLIFWFVFVLDFREPETCLFVWIMFWFGFVFNNACSRCRWRADVCEQRRPPDPHLDAVLRREGRTERGTQLLRRRRQETVQPGTLLLLLFCEMDCVGQIFYYSSICFDW